MEINPTVCKYKNMKKTFRGCIYLYMMICQCLTLWFFVNQSSGLSWNATYHPKIIFKGKN